MQKCDAVMASGQNMISFAIPALRPLVLYLFVRPTLKSAELVTQREVKLYFAQLYKVHIQTGCVEHVTSSC